MDQGETGLQEEIRGFFFVYWCCFCWIKVTMIATLSGSRRVGEHDHLLRGNRRMGRGGLYGIG
ncbi:hypothetical protein COCVIDRAFT_83529 [Bipolaris victoriae FI3]|uniref:Uncharacterized protein n=1 Tax=Bipolaris victoriae (strain FI3) TaxID=930091 RepID=W7ERL8_BIPV3|nr:hypothetical protein COCVIDRAFT_83529 [Bipolaris victoriae FI3]